MLNLEQIRKELSDRQLHIVAARCELSRKTLYNIMGGSTPNYQTIKKLSDYLTKKPEQSI